MSEAKKRRLVITGGLGFIGNAVIAELLKRNDLPYDIEVFDNYSVGSSSNLATTLNSSEEKIDSDLTIVGPVKIFRGDLRDYDRVAEVISDADTVVHLAAQTGVPGSLEDPRKDLETNVAGTFNILEALRKADKKSRIVFSSSNAPLGFAKQPVDELTFPDPISPYGASKLTCENYLKVYARCYGLDAVALRFGNVYGPGSFLKSSVVAKFIKQALDGETLEIYGDGSATRDFIFIDDLVAAILASIDVELENFELFQISTGKETEVGHLTEILCDCFEEQGLKRPTVKFGAVRQGDMQRNFSNVAKAKDNLGWSAQMDIKKGVARTLQYFLNLNAK